LIYDVNGLPACGRAGCIVGTCSWRKRMRKISEMCQDIHAGTTSTAHSPSQSRDPECWDAKISQSLDPFYTHNANGVHVKTYIYHLK
jgi:hypothetical protein